MAQPLEISVVVCVFNEEDNILPMISNIDSALNGYDYEMVFVDDGSSDKTLSILKSHEHPRLVVVELRKNYGQSSALAAGIEVAEGKFIVTMDGDLQNDPSDIPMMHKMAVEEEWDLVHGIRANRKDGMFLRKVPSKIANYMIQRSSGVRIKDYGCTLKVFRKEIAKDLELYGELHRFIPVLANLEGARITQVDVKHHARQHGASKYGINRTFKVVSDLLYMLFLKRYMQKPMHLFGGPGIIILGIGILINFYLLVLKIFGQDIWGKPLLILGALMVMTGIQLITFGIIVQLVVRTYYQSRGKSYYEIRNIYREEENLTGVPIEGA